MPGQRTTDAGEQAGDVVGPVTIDAVAHGGHFVGRWHGRVLFVRHTMIGEQVMVRLTDTSRPSFWLADAVEVLRAAPGRVVPPCPVAGTCGGCDFQHLTASTQRRLKGMVVAEQLQRLARVDAEQLARRSVADLVEPASGHDPDALLGWRTRVHYRVVGSGAGATRLALRQHHSHDLVELPDDTCLIAEPSITGPQLRGVAPGTEGLLGVAADDEAVLVPLPASGAPLVHHRVLGLDYAVSATGFWQVHPRAATVLARTVLDMVQPRAGESALDLYCGVGLFAGQLDAAGLRVVGVESDAAAIAAARRNVPGARFRVAPVERMTRSLPASDVVVLDPPRKGAGARVVEAVSQLRPRAIVYVACDPAALARDVSTFARHGYRPAQLRAFDLFPMTHHVECVMLLEPDPEHRAAVHEASDSRRGEREGARRDAQRRRATPGAGRGRRGAPRSPRAPGSR